MNFFVTLRLQAHRGRFWWILQMSMALAALFSIIVAGRNGIQDDGEARTALT
jgi:hypothetical protein